MKISQEELKKYDILNIIYSIYHLESDDCEYEIDEIKYIKDNESKKAYGIHYMKYGREIRYIVIDEYTKKIVIPPFIAGNRLYEKYNEFGEYITKLI